MKLQCFNPVLIPPFAPSVVTMSGESEEEYEESSEEPFESNSEDDWKPNQESSDESDGEFQTGSSPSPEKKR